MTFDNIWQFDLRRGSSSNPREGACLYDAISWFEYGHLGDHPLCSCPVQSAYGRLLNDMLPDDLRRQLKLRIPRAIGTVDPSAELPRAEYAVRRTIREVLPIALRSAGLDQAAQACASLAPDAPMSDYWKAAARTATAATAEAVRVAREVGAADAAAVGARAAAVGVARAADAAAKAAATVRVAREVGAEAARVALAAGGAVGAAGGAAEAARVALAAEAARAALMAGAKAAAKAAAEVAKVTISIYDGMLSIGRQAEPIEAARIARTNRSFELARG